MENVALITGASSGIGKELAREFAQNRHDLVLVARNMDRLKDIQKQFESTFGVKIKVIAKDLGSEKAPLEIFEQLKSEGIKIDYLVNNAGFGTHGKFGEISWEREQDMIHLNIRTVTYFCKLFIPEMVKNGGGKIMNVASTAAFQPLPYMSVYGATKAYVLSLSEGLANEYKKDKITVTALCPGATTSSFQENAAMGENLLFKGIVSTANSVAKYGYGAMQKGKAVAIPGMMNKIMAGSIRFTPRSIARNLAGKMAK